MSTGCVAEPRSVGYTLTVRNSDNKYYMRRTTFSTNPQWKKFGDRQFNSSPTCVMQTPSPGTDTKFVLAGKGTDNRLYAIEGNLPAPTDIVPPNPDWTGPWAQVSATQYSTNASPAVSSNGSRIVLGFVSNSRVLMHHRVLPYASNSGNTTPVQSPTFPSGVTVSGTPAITYLAGSFNKFVVMVRGTSGGTNGLYWIYYTGTAFQGNWVQGFTGGVTVSSDPAIEWDYHNDAFTVYVRSGNSVIQTSTTGPGGIGVYPWYAIPQSNTTILGTPRAVYGGGIEGIRAAVVRGYGPQTSGGNNRGLLVSEVFGIPDPFPPF